MADNLDPELQRQMNEEMQKFKESISSIVPAMVLMTAAMREQISASKGLTGTQKEGSKVVDDWLKAQASETAATNSAAAATKKYNESMNNLNQALYSGAASLASFGKAVMSVDGGMAKYNNSIASAGDAAMSAGKAFGPLGMLFGGLAKVLSKIVGTVLEFNDNMLKGTDSLSKMGAIGDITTTKFREMGARAGYSAQRLDEFAGVIKGLGTEIIGLGGTAAEGAKAFAKLAEADDDLLNQYSRLGVTQNQLNKNQADYIKLQISAGQQITERSKQDGSLRKASMEYTDNLLELSSLSGMEVDDIKKKQEMNRQDLAFSTRLALMQDKEIALRTRAEETGNKEMMAQADRIKQERENMKALQDVAGTMGMSEKEMAGFNSMLSTGNFNELSAGFAAGTPGILEFIKAVKEGKKSPEELRLFMAEATAATRKSMGEAIIQNKEIGDNVAYSSGLIKNEAKFRDMTIEQQKEMIAKDKAEREKQRQGGVDAAKDARAEQQTTERRMQIAGDQLTSVIQGPITKAFEMFQKAMNVVAKYLAKFAVWLGAPDFTDMFKTPEELKKEQKENIDSLKDTTDKISKYKEALADPEKFKKNLQQQKETTEKAYLDQAQQTEDLKKQRKEAKTVEEKAELDKQLADSRKLEQEKKNAADAASLELRNIKQYQNKQVVEEKLLELTKKKIELEEKQKATSARIATTTEGATGKPEYGELAKKLEAGGITDKKAQANILAQIKAESGGIAKSENLNYSGSKLFEMYGEGNKAGNKVRFKNKAEAEELAAKGPEAIGNVIYGGRMGNTADEGYKYRGRGLIQLTGKDNYAKFAKLTGVDLVKDPDLANDPEIAQRIAVEYFKEKQKQNVNLADIAQVGKAVGYAGGEEETKRRSQYAQEFLQQGRNGGIFSGSESGYPVMLHGKEMVIPMPDAKSSLNVDKQELGDATATSSTTVNNDTTSIDNAAMMFEIFEMMSKKMDDMINKLSDSNDIQDQLLKVSRV